MRACIYARISDDREETQLGVGRQIADCEALATNKAWQIVERYVDNDISAYTGKIRPEYRRMLDDIAAGRIDAVVVYHQDRLHRQPRELEEFFDVCDRAGVRNMATVSGDVDLSTDDGRFHARIMGAVARKSSDDQSRRIRRKHLEIAQAGRPAGGGSRPFGFEDDRVTIRESEASVIRELAERLLAGESIRSLCVDLGARDIRTVSGIPWQPTVLRRMMHSARISGQRSHRGEVVADAVWPAIITPRQREQIVALFADPSRRPKRAPQKYPLRGLLRCSLCGAQLVSRPRQDGRRRYVCAKAPRFTGCGKIAVLGEPIEMFVTEAVLTALDSPELAEAVRGKVRASTDATDQARIDLLTRRLDELAAVYAEGSISIREWLAARDPLQGQIDTLRQSVARESSLRLVEEHVGRGGVLRGEWDGLGIGRQHALLRAMLVEVLVSPALYGRKMFDPTRFELIWRH